MSSGRNGFRYNYFFNPLCSLIPEKKKSSQKGWLFSFPGLQSKPCPTSGFLAALNDGVTSAIISFLRTLVFQTASVMLLPLVLDIDGIWYSVVVAELMAIVISAFFPVQKRKKYHYM